MIKTLGLYKFTNILRKLIYGQHFGLMETDVTIQILMNFYRLKLQDKNLSATLLHCNTLNVFIILPS